MDGKIYEYIMSNFKFYNKSNKWGCPNFSKDLTQPDAVIQDILKEYPEIKEYLTK